MEYASYLAGERWSDHPACTHPLLASLARNVNDLTSNARRDLLTPFIHRVVGLTTDDPHATALVAALAAAAAIPHANLDRQRALAAGLLNVLNFDPSDDLAQLAEAAFAKAPDLRPWALHHLQSTSITLKFTERAAYAMVEASVLGIAHACVADPDDVLRRLLSDAIEAVEAVRGHSAAVIDAINQEPSLLTS
jgi:hypothetical protein